MNIPVCIFGPSYVYFAHCAWWPYPQTGFGRLRRISLHDADRLYTFRTRFDNSQYRPTDSPQTYHLRVESTFIRWIHSLVSICSRCTVALKFPSSHRWLISWILFCFSLSRFLPCNSTDVLISSILCHFSLW